MNSINSSLKLLNNLITKEKNLFKGENIERYSSKDIRKQKLLKAPEHIHYNKEKWFIYVPDCFNECLDISKTNRTVKTGRKILDEKSGRLKEETKLEKKWTQGSRFSFHRGCTLYDTPKAYQEWDKAIREIKYCISVENGMNARPAVNFDDRFPGEVEFTIFTSSNNKNTLQKIERFTLTQDDFVRFLIQGNSDIIPDNDRLF